MSKKEKRIQAAVALLFTVTVWITCTVLFAPFLLAIKFGWGWLLLNGITVPAYIYSTFVIESFKPEPEKPKQRKPAPKPRVIYTDAYLREVLSEAERYG